MTILAGFSGLIRILLSGASCTCLYLAMVVGLFRLTEPVRVWFDPAGSAEEAIQRRSSKAGLAWPLFR